MRNKGDGGRRSREGVDTTADTRMRQWCSGKPGLTGGMNVGKGSQAKRNFEFQEKDNAFQEKTRRA